jgi:nitrite reductase/ring-hydroxylating ferredoxin subunit
VSDFSLSRRGLLSGSAVALVGGVAGWAVGRRAARATAGTPAANAYGTPPPASGRRLLALGDLPAGSGVVLRDPAVVLTRAASGEVHAFSSVCTHQGCTVDRVAGGIIDCPCHGSRFDAGTGAVRAGPATRPLPPVPVEVRDGGIYSS